MVLTFADGNGGLEGFAAAVQRLSHGTIQIRFSGQGLKQPPDFEAGIIADVRAGKADLGWVGSRAIGDFDALTAPLLIDSLAFEAEVLKSQVTESMLRALEPLGLTPIGVLPGPLRWLAGARPLREPADFVGLRISTQKGNVADATLKALGAVPVPRGRSQVLSGLDGVEESAASLAGNRFYSEAPYVTGDIALWPRPPVVFAGPGRTSRRRRSRCCAAPRARRLRPRSRTSATGTGPRTTRCVSAGRLCWPPESGGGRLCERPHSRSTRSSSARTPRSP